MPTYQYRCLDCELLFELRQSFNDQPIADCPQCKGVSRRIFCPVPILFKGPGFYVTDSRGDGDRKSGAEATAAKD
ncbi:MAG: FmdB family zinc ribbon protein [Dehalococcoidia bacterium]|jgi:putative FmdB family regulatory protein